MFPFLNEQDHTKKGGGGILFTTYIVVSGLFIQALCVPRSCLFRLAFSTKVHREKKPS